MKTQHISWEVSDTVTEYHKNNRANWVPPASRVLFLFPSCHPLSFDPVFSRLLFWPQPQRHGQNQNWKVFFPHLFTFTSISLKYFIPGLWWPSSLQLTLLSTWWHGPAEERHRSVSSAGLKRPRDTGSTWSTLDYCFCHHGIFVHLSCFDILAPWVLTWLLWGKNCLRGGKRPGTWVGTSWPAIYWLGDLMQEHRLLWATVRPASQRLLCESKWRDDGRCHQVWVIIFIT